MRVRLWGTRGSLASPGADTARYGGNTSCVEVRGGDDTLLVLDAGTGIRPLGRTLAAQPRRIDLLLTHLHMDHIQGLGFFEPLHIPNFEVHIWGPASTTLSLKSRLMRYLSPPLFPVRLRDLACTLFLHEVRTTADFEIGEFHISSALVCHPDPTLGYRIANANGSLTFISDHEPALGAGKFPLRGDWTSGFALARHADLLIHDAQYTGAEYPNHVGWGHSSFEQTFAFAAMAGVKHLVTYHHDPAHTDDELDRALAAATAAGKPPFAVTPGCEGFVFELGPGGEVTRRD